MSDEALRFAIWQYITSAGESCEDEDRSESLEVASQCLPEGFGIDTENQELMAKYKLPCSLLEIFEAGLASCKQRTISHQDRLQNDPKYSKFIATLTTAGFFKGIEEGTPEYDARLVKAQDTYVAKYGSASSNQTTDAPASAPAVQPEPTLTEEQQKERVEQAEQLKAQGNQALGAKNFDQAVDFYTQALAIRPGHAIYLCNRAAALSYLDRHAEAVTDAEAALEKDPSYVKGYSRLGFALFKLGQYQEAVDVYERGLEQDQGNASLQAGLAEAKTKIAPAAAGAGGMADLMNMAQGMMNDPNAMANLQNMMGGMGGQGGAPDIGALLNNPMLANMAQNMMQNPEMMQNMMGMMGGMGAAAGNSQGDEEEDGPPAYEELN